MKRAHNGWSRGVLNSAVLCCLAAILLLSNKLIADDAAAPAPPPASAVAPAGPAANPAANDMLNPSLFKLFMSGGKFMYALAVCSIMAVAIIIERLFSLRRSQVIPRGFLPGLKTVFRDPRDDREAAINYCRTHDSPIARMIIAGLRRLPRGLSAAEKAIEDAGANEALKLRRYMRFLYALGSVATLLGLIGTISGMIRAFMATAAGNEGPSRVAALSTGIYEAMVNTFGGLAVAIVVTIFYYFFIGRIERLISELNDALAEFSDDYGFNAESDAELSVTRTL
jgi:biopolymer transport protein ExbB